MLINPDLISSSLKTAQSPEGRTELPQSLLCD